MAKVEVKAKKKWRKRVKKAMHKATIKESVERYKTPYPLFNYRWEHVKNVVTLAVRLAELLDADVEVVEAAAWLHDIAKHKAKSRHPEKGAERARKLLSKTDFPENKIERVAYSIENHMGLWRDAPLEGLEAQILWDADKLSKIGLTAVFHNLGTSFAFGNIMTTKRMIENGRDLDWLEKTVESMHTKPARRAAKQRLKAYRNLWDSFEDEINGADLG